MKGINVALLLIVFVCITVLFFICFEKMPVKDANTNKEKILHSSDSMEEEKTESLKIAEHQKEEKITENTGKTLEELITSEQAVELGSWDITRGYTFPDNQTDYMNYDINTLRGLAENGDVVALQQLGLKLISEKNYEEGIARLTEASVLGYTASSMEIANTYYSLAYTDELEVEESEALINAYAWFKFSESRGDLRGRLNINIYKLESSLMDLELYNQANRKADIIYLAMSQARERKNLLPFDNSSPYAHKVIMNMMLRPTTARR